MKNMSHSMKLNVTTDRVKHNFVHYNENHATKPVYFDVTFLN